MSPVASSPRGMGVGRIRRTVGPGIPWSGCVPAEPASVSPDRFTVRPITRHTQGATVRTVGYRERKHAFLLAGMVRCAACGKPKTHTVVARKNKRYYHCDSRVRCDQQYVPEELLNEEVQRLIASIELTPKFIDATVAKAREIHERDVGTSVRCD